MNRPHKLSTFKDAEMALRPFVPLVSELTGKDTVLDRILPLMEQLGNPQDKLRTIHIAGTSGKTSTSYYISALLSRSGLTVGLTVSPNIDKLSERTQINGQPLDEKTFCSELETFLELVNKSQISPSYFELMYAFSIWLFAKCEVDYAVIETGMGGLYDATNIVTREDKVCVITDIGYDHMHILGDTIAKITTQKVGIVHPHNPLLMYQQSEEVMSVIESWVKDHDASLYLTTETEQAKVYGHGQSFNDLPNFQKRNWLLAYFVYRFVAKRDNLDDLNQPEIEESQAIRIPARMDAVKVKDKLLIMDGAHNQQKMEAFTSSFKHKYPSDRPAILLAFKTGKDYLKVIPLLKDFTDYIIITTFETSQDLPVKSIEPTFVAESLKQAGISSVIVEPDQHKAYGLLLDSQSKVLVITGSFYLISQLRESEIQID